MNKTLLSAALMAGFGMAAFAPQVAKAATNTITFNGKVLSSTCSASVNGGTNGGTVTLPDVAVSDLSATGAYTPSATQFNMVLTNCPITPAGVKVGAQFYSATNADTSTGNGTLKNSTAPGSATGVDVQLLDSASTPVTITSAAPAINDNTNVTDSTTLSGATASLAYTAQYYVTNAAPAAGLVSTNVNFVINYQ